MVKVKVNYAELDFEEIKIIEFEYRKYEDLCENLLNKLFYNTTQNIYKYKKGIVFLLQIDFLDEIFVTTKVDNIYEYIEWGVIDDLLPINEESDGILDISIHEYNSFEEAYRNALRLKETDVLCYNTDN